VMRIDPEYMEDAEVQEMPTDEAQRRAYYLITESGHKVAESPSDY